MTNLEYKIFKTGYCLQNELCSIVKGKNIRTKFYAMAVLIKHPTIGNILFDTGYTKEFYKAAENFPYSLYAKATPVIVTENDSVKKQLINFGIKPDEINYIIISHFHADHIAGLKDFKNAKFLCIEDAWNDIKNKKGFFAVKEGLLPDLLPDDFANRVEFISNKKNAAEYIPFNEVYDIFGDESILGVNLSGHAKGQLGIILNLPQNPVFFIADACWYSKSYRENIPPPLWIRLLLGNNKKYLDTLWKLHIFYNNNPNMQIIPSHCNEFWSNNA